jgi:hypothetical protein
MNKRLFKRSFRTAFLLKGLIKKRRNNPKTGIFLISIFPRKILNDEKNSYSLYGDVIYFEVEAKNCSKKNMLVLERWSV